MITLYSYYRSPAAYRVRIAMALKDLEYKYEGLHPVRNGGEQHTPEYKTLNPQSMVPMLIDGKVILTQSLAILEYLEEKYQEPALLPKKLDSRAFVRQIMNICATDIHPLNTLRVLNYISGEFGTTQAQKIDWQKNWLMAGFNSIEQLLEESTHRTGKYCCGKKITLADICLVSQIYEARRLDIDISTWPIIEQIEKTCLDLESFQMAAPEQQPDTPDNQRPIALKGNNA